MIVNDKSPAAESDGWVGLPDIKELSGRLKWARKLRGLTQPELAQKAGVSVDVIKKAETFQTDQPRAIVAIAKALDVSPGWLAYNHADLDKLGSQALQLALDIQDLSQADRDAVARLVASLRRDK